MKRLVIELEDTMHQQMKEISVKTSKSMKKIVTDLIVTWSKKQEK